MPKLESSQHGPFTGVDASSGAFVNPQGTVPRASNLVSIQRGSLATCDGSAVLAWHSGQIQSGDSKIIALSVFQPTGVSPYYLALKQTGAFPMGPGFAEAAAGGSGPSVALTGSLSGSHTYVITTLDGIGGESKPTPPVTATAVNGCIYLTWDGVPNAYGYNIYRDGQLLATSPGVGTPCGGPPIAAGGSPAPTATATLPILQTCGVDAAGNQTYQFAYIDTGAATALAPLSVTQADTLVNQAGVVQFTVASTVGLPPGQAFTVSGLTDGNGNPILNGTYIITNIVNATTFQAVPVGVIPAPPTIPPPPPPPPPNVPGITFISPNSGVAGNSVTITGSNFGATQSGSTVTFNGLSASVTNWSSTSIMVTVPSGVTSGSVIVTVGGQASNGVTFTVATNTRPVPAITSINPTSGVAGNTATITGTNFGATVSGSVTFNGILASITSWGNTSIVVTVPSGVTTGPVVVTAGGQSSNSVTFTVVGTVTGTTIALASIVGGVTIPGGPYNNQVGLSLILQKPWSPSIALAVGNSVTVSGTGLYDGNRIVAGLSPGPDPYGMTLVAVTSNTAIVLNQGQVTLP